MIRFEKVSLTYPHTQRSIIDDLTFEIEEGELVLVMGSTGIGKSSLLRLVNGLIPHHTQGILTGEITINGRSTSLNKPGSFADIVGVVGQNPAQSFVYDKVIDEIAFGLETLGVTPEIIRRRIEEVLDLLSLSHLRERDISTLSGGEQQRVAIASALVMSPKILLLDEPTSALDPVAAEEVLAILHKLVHDLGLTVLLAEHRLERVVHLVDRILLIEDGRVHIDSAERVMALSRIVPPIVELSRLLEFRAPSLSTRQFRRELTHSPLGLNLDKMHPTGTGIDQHTVLESGHGDQRCVASLTGVDLNYGPKRALRRCTLEFSSGEITALMGRNGSGKSSLIKVLIGIQRPTHGEVRIADRSPHELEGKELVHTIGYIPQEPQELLYCMSVREECLSADRDSGLPQGTTMEMLHSFDLQINPQQNPRDLSEGERLILALAIVLAGKPRLLALDEPTRGLDYSAKRHLISVLHSAKAMGTSVVIATHDVELVAELADRTVFLSEGELIAVGLTREVLLASPAFAPQVAKVFPRQRWITVQEVRRTLEDRATNDGEVADNVPHTSQQSDGVA